MTSTNIGGGGTGFNTQNFLQSAGQGQSPIQSIGAGFGIPSCMLNLTEELLSLIPSPILNAMNLGVTQGAETAASVIRDIKRWLLSWFGIGTYTDENGETVYYLESFRNGVSPASLLDTISQFVGFATGFAGAIYNEAQALAGLYDEVADCIAQFELSRKVGKGYEEFVNDGDIENFSSRYRAQVDTINATQARLDEFIALQGRIKSVLAARLENPDLEPELRPEAIDLLRGLGFRIAPSVLETKREELIRLAYGPPESKKGKFVLSVDGLYYDSQTSGITPVLTDLYSKKESLEANLNWKLDQDPNLGGRGKEFTSTSFKTYINTILDDNVIDDTVALKDFYEEDEILQDLIGQKNRRIFDVSAQLKEAVEGVSSIAIIENLRQALLSESSHFMPKINKRKKQIELAVKMPVIYKNKSLYMPGEIPVNDFSYLEGINFELDVGRQRKLTLNQEDVSSVVLPLQVKYVQQLPTSDEVVFDHLILNSVGVGAIASDMSGIVPPQLTLNQSIETDKLVALYNLLKFNIEEPSSTVYSLRNSSELGDYANAQIVGTNEETVFNQGVGIPYLQGITKHSQSNTKIPSSIGSYIKLPAISELQDLFYNRGGCTFESWVYAPNLSSNSGYNDSSVSGLYRLILANENTGLSITGTKQNDILTLTRDSTNDTVKGMIFGFTRDRRFTSNQAPSNNNSDNPASAGYIIIAPTQSYDLSSVGFINKSFDIAQNCYDTSNVWYSLKYPINSVVNGVASSTGSNETWSVAFSSCTNQFCQIAFTLDQQNNLISLYCDGRLMTTSTFTDVFGLDSTKNLISIPTTKKSNSFEYNSINLDSTAPAQLKAGPKNDEYFTPWIVGGGYTDGYKNGNFMGGTYGGIISGLKGHIGGIKVYSKPLTAQEILNNYNAGKNFFKNIKV